MANHDEQSPRVGFGSQNGNAMSSSYGTSSKNNGFELTARKMHSAENLNTTRWNRPGGGSNPLSPALSVEPGLGQSSQSDWALHDKQSVDERHRAVEHDLGLEYSHEDSKWIHRDKLAKIESAELQAAGFVLPKSMTSARQRRERNNDVHVSRGADSTDHDHDHTRPRNDQSNRDGQTEEPSTPHWDLRTPEEILNEEANAYFTSQSAKGGSRIPVAKTSPAPIPLDYLERGSPAIRKHRDSLEGDMLAYPKTRSRSASASGRDIAAMTAGGAKTLTSRRSVTDTSPRKNTPRKTSTASKSSTTTGRPKTRSGPNGGGTRPTTRSGEPSAASRQPEGDPPWMFDSYKPDPRLPPDQQLLPTVARRLQQEQWEKEGKFGDTYDRDLRPLNNNEFAPPPEKEAGKGNEEEEDHDQQSSDWPLKPGAAAKSPKQSSYSTMPRITDKPPVGPMPSPRVPGPQHASGTHDLEALNPADDEAEKKAGCGCCVVM